MQHKKIMEMGRTCTQARSQSLGHAATIWDTRSGSRRSDRPETKWRDDMKKQAGNLYIRTARNRNNWKKYIGR